MFVQFYQLVTAYFGYSSFNSHLSSDAYYPDSTILARMDINYTPQRPAYWRDGIFFCYNQRSKLTFWKFVELPFGRLLQFMQLFDSPTKPKMLPHKLEMTIPLDKINFFTLTSFSGMAVSSCPIKKWTVVSKIGKHMD